MARRTRNDYKAAKIRAERARWAMSNASTKDPLVINWIREPAYKFTVLCSDRGLRTPLVMRLQEGYELETRT